jgi:hypothetical protein
MFLIKITVDMLIIQYFQQTLFLNFFIFFEIIIDKILYASFLSKENAEKVHKLIFWFKHKIKYKFKFNFLQIKKKINEN